MRLTLYERVSIYMYAWTADCIATHSKQNVFRSECGESLCTHGK